VRDKNARPQSGVRARTAILRTLVDELAREDCGRDVVMDLRSQAIEETAPERVAAGFSAGGTTYLVKPLDLELLEEELARALADPFA